MPARLHARQFAPLVRIFIARFFENDLTSSAHDLTRSFFGLLAILGVPGALWPFVIGFTWTLVGRFQGVAVLRGFSRGDKDLYLGFTMIASAALVALTWNTLFIDRRDAVVLGALPVRPRLIIGAKLAALGFYLGTVAVTMHGLAACFWGLFLDEGRGRSLAFLLRGIVAHFLAGTAASTFTVLVVLSVQGVVLALGGPRVFARLSGLFQVALVVAIGVALIVFPSSGESVVHALAFPADQLARWTLAVPPAWFLGLYEWLLGGLGHSGSDLILRHLASTAATGLAASAGVALVSNVLAYQRVMRSAVAQDLAVATTQSGPARWLAGLITRRPNLQGVASFVLVSMSRVERQRLALGIGLGVAVAWTLPVLPAWPTRAAAPVPDPTLLALPLALMAIWLAALRVAASLPSDLRGAWIFEIHRPDPVAVRSLMVRLFLMIGVLPCAGLSALAVGLRWGPWPAAVHAIVEGAVGLLLVEALVTGIADVPGTQPWRPERARLRSRWPFYLFGFLWLAAGFPLWPAPGNELEVLLAGSLVGTLVFGLLVAGAIVLVRRYSLERLRVEELLPRTDETLEGSVVTVRLN